MAVLGPAADYYIITKIIVTIAIPVMAPMSAATPVRIPGKDVQNDFLLSSPIPSFTMSYSDLLSRREIAADYS
jgi:hypothetical protein